MIDAADNKPESSAQAGASVQLLAAHWPSRLRRIGLFVASLAGLLVVKWLIPERQAPQHLGSDRTSSFTGIDSNFTVLVTVGKIQLVIPDKLLVYPWPRDAPGIIVPCPHQEQIHPHADGCLQAVATSIGLKVPMSDAPGHLSQRSFIVDVSVTFAPETKWAVSPLNTWLKNNNTSIVRRVQERDVPGYDAYQDLPSLKIAGLMSKPLLDEFKRSYTFIPKTKSVLNSITCNFVRDDNTEISNSICEAIYPFSPGKSTWFSYPDYKIEYHFPGKDFSATAEIGEWLGMKTRKLMRDTKALRP